MAFNVSIQITAESKVEAIKQAEQQLKALSATAQHAGTETEKGAQKAAGAFDLLQRRSLGAQRAAGLVAGELGQLGPAGQIASSGLFALAAGGGFAGLAIAGVSTGVAALVSYLTSAAKAKEEFDNAIRTGDLGFFRAEITKTDQEIVKLTTRVGDLGRELANAVGSRPDLEARLKGAQAKLADAEGERAKGVEAQQKILAEKYRDTTLAIEFQTAAVGASAAEMEELAHELRVTTALQSDLKDASDQTKNSFIEASTALRNAKVGENAKRAAEAINQQVVALQFQTAAIGRTGSALDAINLAQQRFNITQQFAGQGYDAQRGKILAQADAMFQLKRAYDQIATGRQGITDFQNQFGVTLDIEKKIAGSNLADKFGVFFNKFKNDVSKQGQIAEAFNSLIRQSIDLGVPDIPELLVEKIGSANFARLSAGLTQELKKPLDDSMQAGQQWGKVFEKEFQNFNAGAAEVGGSIDQIKKKQEELMGMVAQPLALNVDVSAALAGIQDILAQHTTLRAQLSVPIPVVIQHYGSGSPTLPISDYLGNYLPRKIAGIGDLSPDLVINIPDFTKRAREAAELQAEITRLAIETPSFDVLGKQNSQYRTARIGDLSAQLEDLRFGVARDVSIAQQQTAGRQQAGGVSGGGVTNVFNLDMRGASINHDFLDRELLPKIERLVREATGKDIPGWRVLS